MVIVGPTAMATVLVELAIQKRIDAGVGIGVKNGNSIYRNGNCTS